jgi:hypothetical protein
MHNNDSSKVIDYRLKGPHKNPASAHRQSRSITSCSLAALTWQKKQCVQLNQQDSKYAANIACKSCVHCAPSLLVCTAVLWLSNQPHKHVYSCLRASRSESHHALHCCLYDGAVQASASRLATYSVQQQNGMQGAI